MAQWKFRGNVDIACKILSEIIQGGRGDAVIFANLGEINEERGDPATAERLYKQSLDLDPHSESLLCKVANISLTVRGDVNCAKDYYRKAVLLNPENVEAMDQLKCCEASLGE
eukprot:CAMPEP_0184328472 /NCGR_PEP_ID=MMETSP1049-20130417/143640_1 /TAXON_ID=77928 /ORGANISM="Proteomonas sulcata, Strain CCMP704" /LENGTH=112 /DNA_ID=CAMNT_0026650785 /DNA_START=186 /DNA_END=524 /DNA_ORIENTATION=-